MTPDRFAAILDRIPPERLYRALIDSNVVGVTITGEEELHAANDHFLELVGRTRADLERGLRWTDISAPQGADADAAAMRELRDTGRVGPFEKAYLRPDGSEVPVMLSGMRIQEEPLLALATVYDLSEREAVEQQIAALYEREREARLAAELAGLRIGRLQDITARLSASRSPDEIARVVVHHAIEDVAASAGMLTRVVGGELIVVHAVGYPRAVVDQWRRFPLGVATPPTDAIRLRRPVAVASSEDRAHRYPQLGSATAFEAAVAVPLFSSDRALGAFILSFREPRTLDPDDLEFLTALAVQAATALERGALFENRAYVARKLQEGLLPQRLPDVPGLDAAVRYRSVTGGEVGGDFYDLFAAGTDRWAVAVGDVCGKGTEAAVITGLARHTVRAVAWVKERPAEVLSFLNDALRRHAAEPSFCTVGFAILRPSERGGFRASLASGGHPYPIALRVGAPPEPIVVTGTMLGAADDPQIDEVEVHLAPGDALIMYTDGIPDARRPGGERFGEARLLSTLNRVRDLDADAIAGAIDDAVVEHDPEAPTDDRAVIVLRAVS